MWHNIWHLQVGVGEKVLRSAIVYLVLIGALRVFGKRELGQATTFDFVVLLMVANAVQNGIIGNDVSVTGAIIGAVVLLALNQLVSAVAYRSERFEHLAQGKPTTLIENGKLNRPALRRELISTPDLNAIARRQGYDGLAEIDRAILETNGQVTLFRRGESQVLHPDEPPRALV